MAFDKLGNLWIGTSNGISVYREGGIISDAKNISSFFKPEKFFLNQNFPNPFNPSTKISYQIQASLNPSQGGTLVTLKVYDILGKEVATLVNKEQTTGTYEVNFDASNLPSGVYIYKMKAGEYVETKKMILLK